MNATTDKMTLGEAARFLRKRRGMTLTQVAALMDEYDAGGLSKFERGSQGMQLHKLEELAQVLGVRPSTLYAIAESDGAVLQSKPEMLTDQNIISFNDEVSLVSHTLQKVPLISAVQAGQWLEIVDEVLDSEMVEWVHTVEKVGPKAFALRVQGDSMTNPYHKYSLPEDTLLIVDPDIAPANRSIVIVRKNDERAATVKQLVIEGDTKYLKPLNPQYPILQLNSECELIGTALQIATPLPR